MARKHKQKASECDVLDVSVVGCDEHGWRVVLNFNEAGKKHSVSGKTKYDTQEHAVAHASQVVNLLNEVLHGTPCGHDPSPISLRPIAQA